MLPSNFKKLPEGAIFDLGLLVTDNINNCKYCNFTLDSPGFSSYECRRFCRQCNKNITPRYEYKYVKCVKTYDNIGYKRL
jgi:hypothetical protein